MRILFVLYAVAVSSFLLNAQDPPIKMGLWEKTMTTSGLPQGTVTVKSKSCITPESWKKMMANATKPRPNCKIDMVKNARGYTFKGTCSDTLGGSSTMDGSTTIHDPEQIVSDTHSATTVKGQRREINNHSVSQFVSSNCGGIDPDDPVIEDK